MMADLYPWQALLVTLAGWVNRHQQHVIEYLVEENRVLKELMKGRRLRLTDDQRRRLAVRARKKVSDVIRRSRASNGSAIMSVPTKSAMIEARPTITPAGEAK
jgi:hypothetical protein